MLLRLFTLKYWLLRNPNFWFIDNNETWSIEMDYLRRPRQFLKHRLYKKYKITSIYLSKPYTKEKAVDLFIKKYECGELFGGTLAVIQNNDTKPDNCSFCIFYCIKPNNCESKKYK